MTVRRDQASAGHGMSNTRDFNAKMNSIQDRLRQIAPQAPLLSPHFGKTSDVMLSNAPTEAGSQSPASSVPSSAEDLTCSTRLSSTASSVGRSEIPRESSASKFGTGRVPSSSASVLSSSQSRVHLSPKASAYVRELALIEKGSPLLQCREVLTNHRGTASAPKVGVAATVAPTAAMNKKVGNENAGATTADTLRGLMNKTPSGVISCDALGENGSPALDPAATVLRKKASAAYLKRDCGSQPRRTLPEEMMLRPSADGSKAGHTNSTGTAALAKSRARDRGENVDAEAESRSNLPSKDPSPAPSALLPPKKTNYSRELENMRLSSPQVPCRDIRPKLWDGLNSRKGELEGRKQEAGARQQEFLAQMAEARNAFAAKTGAKGQSRAGGLPAQGHETTDALDRRLATAQRSWGQTRTVRAAFECGSKRPVSARPLVRSSAPLRAK